MPIQDAIDALLDYEQADMDGVIVKASRQAIHEVVDDHARLTAENIRLEVFYAEAFPIINRLAYDQTPRNAGMRYDQLIAARKAMDAVSSQRSSNENS